MKRRTMAAIGTSAGALLPALLAVCLGGAPARAQTVADYAAALAAVPAGGATKPSSGDACAPLVNYTYVSISEDDHVPAFPLGDLLTLVGDDQGMAAPARVRCEAAMKATVIKFDGGLGEDIVPQPQLEDVEAPFKVGGNRGDLGDAYKPLNTRPAGRTMSH